MFRILVIDDEPKWIEFTTHKLSRTFEMDVARDVDTALDKLNNNTYDLLIASARYHDCLKRLHKEHSETRLVVVTGQPTTQEAIEMYRLGAFDYFAKDFRRKVVSEKIQEALAKPVLAVSPL